MILAAFTMGSMALPFPTPTAVRDLLDDLKHQGFDPQHEFKASEIVVVATEGRVKATVVFRRRRTGFLPVTGDLHVDGQRCATAKSAADLRRIVRDPDAHLRESRISMSARRWKNRQNMKRDGRT